jgi:predicted glycosyltransferase
VRYCGYIAREAASRSRAHVRAGLGVRLHEPMLLVTPGGGEDGYRLVATALEGLARTPAHRRPRTHVVCGPEMPEHHRVAVESAAADLPQVSVEGLQRRHDVPDRLRRRGGDHGRLQHRLRAPHSGRRGVIVPRCEPGVEQLLRAERMAERGLLRMVSPDALSPSALMAECSTSSMRWPAPNPCRA